MSFKHVIDVEEVRERMSLENMVEINDAIDSAINAAHAVFRGLLQTEFDQRLGRIDYFFLDADRFPTPRDGLFRCRLAQGFVSSITSVESAGARLDFSEATSVDNGEGYIADLEKGVVSVVADNSTDRYVRVTYNAGISLTNKSPEWLHEAVLLYVPRILANQQITHTAGTSAAQAPSVFGQADGLAGVMIEPYLRQKAMHFRPYYSLAGTLVPS